MPPELSRRRIAGGIEAAAEVAERLGWSTVWTTDHVLVATTRAADYGRIYEAILTLAWVGARHPRLRLGTSVIVVPQRNAVVLAKELATLDSLSDGRVTAGVGVGWTEAEFANLGMADRFHVRGAYLDETIRLWRHCGRGRPSRSMADSTPSRTSPSGRCPVRRRCRSSSAGAPSRPCACGDARRRLPLERRRAGRLRRARPDRRAAAEAAGRPTPWLSARVRVEFRRDG